MHHHNDTENAKTSRESYCPNIYMHIHLVRKYEIKMYIDEFASPYSNCKTDEG